MADRQMVKMFLIELNKLSEKYDLYPDAKQDESLENLRDSSGDKFYPKIVLCNSSGEIILSGLRHFGTGKDDFCYAPGYCRWRYCHSVYGSK